MKITREKACQRLHHRIRSPLSVCIDGNSYTAVDWSLGGFRLAGWSRDANDLDVHQTTHCDFELPFQGFNIDFNAEIKMVRVDESAQEAAFCFVELDERQVELLSHFIEQLVRGSMTPVQDTILRIDSPVTPVSTKPDPSPVSEVPVRRIPLKKVFMTGLYLLVGVLLLALTSVTVYENFLSLKVKSAVVYAPVEPLVSLVDGRVTAVNIPLDSYVDEGDELFVIESPTLRKSIDEAKIAIEQKKIELEERRKKYALAIETSGTPASKEARLYEIEVDRIQQEVALATQQLVALYEYKENLSISSPGQGRLVRLLRDQGALIKKGETVALFERQQTPLVHAYISEPDSGAVYISQQVTISSFDRQWRGVVVDIQDYSPGLDKRYGKHLPANLAGQTIRVDIQFYLQSDDRLMALPRPGLPVEVLFPYFEMGERLAAVPSDSDKVAGSTPPSAQQKGWSL